MAIALSTIAARSAGTQGATARTRLGSRAARLASLAARGMPASADRIGWASVTASKIVTPSE
jgi:hypothetical protein